MKNKKEKVQFTEWTELREFIVSGFICGRFSRTLSFIQQPRLMLIA